MRVLITGANGLLGQKLVTLLQSEQDIELIATGRGINRNPAGSYTYLSADLGNYEGLRAFIELAAPELAIHCAAMTQVDECENDREGCLAANVTATEHLISVAKAANAYFLYVSTDFVFDGAAGPYRESDTPSPLSYYGECKLKAEKLVEKSGLKHSIVRTVLVYGAGHQLGRTNIVLWVKQSLENREPIRVVNDQWRTPTLAEDLAMGCWLVAKGKHQGVFHISGSEMMSPYELALNVADFFNLDKTLITPVDASTFTQPAQRPPKTGFIIEKARAELGFEPHSFHEGLEEVARQLAVL